MSDSQQQDETESSYTPPLESSQYGNENDNAENYEEYMSQEDTDGENYHEEEEEENESYEEDPGPVDPSVIEGLLRTMEGFKQQHEMVRAENNQLKEENEKLKSVTESLSVSANEMIAQIRALKSKVEGLVMDLEVEKESHNITLQRLSEAEGRDTTQQEVNGSFYLTNKITVINGKVVQSDVVTEFQEELLGLQRDKDGLLHMITQLKLDLMHKSDMDKLLEQKSKEIETLKTNLIDLEESNKRNEKELALVKEQKLDTLVEGKLPRKSIMQLKNICAGIGTPNSMLSSESKKEGAMKKEL
ncbi:hypothetical protein EIN_197650, partial [Entamoeba invadens IP1]